MSRQRFILALDQGTTSSRAILFCPLRPHRPAMPAAEGEAHIERWRRAIDHARAWEAPADRATCEAV